MHFASQKSHRTPKIFRLFCLSIWISLVLPIMTQAQTTQSDDEVVVKKVVVPKYIRIPVEPNEGHLTLYTTALASITLKPLSPSVSTPKPRNANEGGTAVFSPLTPGDYELKITRDEYQPATAKIKIDKGEATAYNGLLKPSFGTIVLAMGDQAAPDVSILLDNELVKEPERLKIEEGNIYIKRVPVVPPTLREIRIRKPHHEDATIQRVIQPGECNNFIPVKLNHRTISLIVKSRPETEVYLNGARKGNTSAEGLLRIEGLLPGKYDLRASLPGYDDARTGIEFNLAEPEKIVEIKLLPKAEDTQVNVSFNSTISFWTPVPLPPGWNLNPGAPSGLKVTGNDLGLLKQTTQPNRDFNFYRDFTLVLNITFTNGRGAAWVARAQDRQNYYLFELTASPGAGSRPPKRSLNFYVCQGGRCELNRSDLITADIAVENPGTPLRISLEVKGNKFTHRLPDRANALLGGIFEDSTFAAGGGVGLRGINGLEMLVTQFTVLR